MPETIVGLDALTAKLRALRLSQQRALLIEAAKAGAKVISEEAARRAPQTTGRLAGGMAVKVIGRESDLFEASVEVGPGKKQFYGFFVEFGTGSRFAASAARAAGYPGRSRRAKPAQLPRPFLIPAFEAKKDDAAARMRAVMEEGVLRATV